MKQREIGSLSEFNRLIPNDRAAVAYLVSWCSEYVCHNQHTQFEAYDHARFKCLVCGERFSPKIDTIFEGSKVGFRKLLLCIYLLTQHPEISSVALAKAINVSQKTAWKLMDLLRRAQQTDAFKGTSPPPTSATGGGPQPAQLATEAKPHKSVERELSDSEPLGCAIMRLSVVGSPSQHGRWNPSVVESIIMDMVMQDPDIDSDWAARYLARWRDWDEWQQGVLIKTIENCKLDLKKKQEARASRPNHPAKRLGPFPFATINGLIINPQPPFGVRRR